MRNKSLTMLLDYLAMRTRDDLKAVIETLRKRHGLLAAYLEAADRFDWRTLDKPMAIGELAPVVNCAAPGPHQPEPESSDAHVAAS
ncbi:hypothetical protein [Bradyrhizobium sp.]|uniref:hypothetical protein n=1 Tax=Bradyrhizobium sp. TaxID=376 RepID=UPI003C65FF06